MYGLRERDPAPLALLHWPLCVNLRSFRDGNGEGDVGEEGLLLDATLMEEHVCEGEVLVAANVEGEVCMVEKMGGVPVDALVLLRCVDMAVQKANEIGKLLKQALEQDAKVRDRVGMVAELRAENER